MARDLDATLIETVRVRRRRLRDAFVHGGSRSRRVVSNNVRTLLTGIVLAAVACAVCVGVSFVRKHVGDVSSAPQLPPVVSVSTESAGRV